MHHVERLVAPGMSGDGWTNDCAMGSRATVPMSIASATASSRGGPRRGGGGPPALQQAVDTRGRAAREER